MDRIGRYLASATLLVLAACSSEASKIEPLEGMSRIEMHELATEAYSVWDPVSVQLVDVALLRGHKVDATRYDLDIRYTVRKVNEPTLTSHAEQATRVAASAEPDAQAIAAKLRRLARTKPGETVEFTETITLVPYHGTWMPRRWRDNEIALKQRDAARRGAP